MTIKLDAVKCVSKRSGRGLALGLVMAGASGLLPLPSLAQQTPSTPPSIVFLLDNSEGMMEFPQYLPEVGDTTKTGCSDPALVEAMSWFDPASPDPALNGSIPIDPDLEFTGAIEFFDPNQFYVSRGRRLAVNGSNSPDYPYSLEWNFRDMIGNTDAASACHRALRWNYWGSPMHLECQQCLTTKGWWRGNMENNPSQRWDQPPLPPEARRQWVLSGRVLNVRPPKFVMARKVLKDLIDSTNGTRMGVATLGTDRGWYDPPVMKARIRPACNYLSPTIDEVQLDRTLLKQSVNYTRFVNNERSIGEALFGLGGYFSSEAVDGRWTSWFQQPLNPGWGWPGAWNGGTIDNPDTGQPGSDWGHAPEEWTKRVVDDAVLWEYEARETGGEDRSICSADQSSAVIVLTGGRPNYDNTVPITKMMAVLQANGARHPDGSLLTFDPANPQTSSNSGGVNYCHLFGATKEACDYTAWNWPYGLARGNKNFMDDTAFFLSHTDLRGDLPGTQSVRTFVIGLGDSSPMLQSITMAGQGRFFSVNGVSGLRSALLLTMGDVVQGAASSCSAP